ncbi:DUF5996 family protein, partial [Ruminococcaceae bacterium OttesenSCG-928-I18]|nr:DUF5996 family protein [Ruminococcaceae bacterium OttesenSCG-928-I18]
QNYSEWQKTAWALHMILQMMGKTKLVLSYPEPEWNHALLRVTPDGYTTGLIPYGSKSFSVDINIRTSMVSLASANGEFSGFTLQDNKSVSSYFASYNYLLDSMGFEVDINPVPQEVADTTPFDKQTERLEWDQKSALNYLYANQFAHNAIARFTAPFRGKKLAPALFWGTYDMTGILFSGKEAASTGKGYVAKAAFDEQMIEFGFWPGDPRWDEPTLFAVSYPSDGKEYTDDMVRPKEANYNKSYSEFFLPLSAVLRYENPMDEAVRFFEDSFNAYAKDNWDNLEWFTKPLEIHN